MRYIMNDCYNTIFDDYLLNTMAYDLMISCFMQNHIFSFIYYVEKMSKRTYKKIDELTFRYEEDKHFDIKVDAVQMLQTLANAINDLKFLVKQANEAQAKFVKVVDWYNTVREILEEANNSLKLAVKVPPKIEIPDCFDIIEVKVENLPKVEIADRKPKEEEKQG